MSISTKLIKFTNKIFPRQLHPFNMQNDGVKTYAQWQFEKGRDTIQHFMAKYTEEEMFGGKTVLDMGCGAAGKSLYYVKCGAEKVIGVDIMDHYEKEALALAEKLGYSDRFEFICASAYELPFPDNSFDTVIMNDFMEHVDNPEKALLESIRLIRPGGRIYINFPPYYHPFGAHLSDAINMPWVHVFFSDKALISAYKELIHGTPDESERLKLRFSKDENGNDVYSYINRMTIKRFKKILSKNNIKTDYYSEVALRSFLSPLAKLPLTKEMFVKMVACSISK